MKVEVVGIINVNVTLPINSFEEITFDNMSRKDSDELINSAMYEQHGFTVDKIMTVNPK